MKHIEHIVEPERLLLSWQTSQPGKNRGRMFVAELIRKKDDANLIYLVNDKEFRIAQSLGFREYTGFSINQQIHENVLFAFIKRLPPRSRGDYGKYLDSLRIRNNAEISNFALLGYSGAKLPDDDFVIVHTFENAVPPFEFLLNIQGYRYYAKQLPYEHIKMEQEATFEAEFENEIDPRAVKVLIDDIHVGYVCRGLAESFHQWFKMGYKIEATVERKNGTIERPDIYLYVSIKK